MNVDGTDADAKVAWQPPQCDPLLKLLLPLQHHSDHSSYIQLRRRNDQERLGNDKAKERFGKYMKYKGHEERACCSGTFQCITGYNPAQDRIVDLWDAQRHELAIEAEEETSREEETAEVATTLRARRS